MNFHIETSWQQPLQHAITQYLPNIANHLAEQQQQGYTIYPNSNIMFASLNSTPLHKVKIVILGQDPYHQAGQACGLSFSVPQNVAIPPSLRNIYKELQQEYNWATLPKQGNLATWAGQGVLLLNASLSVRANQANSHAHIGWYGFTDAIISCVSAHQAHVVFLLWGTFAQGKKTLIDANKHLILEAPHPSPLSAYRGFFGCNHFKMANDFLQQHTIEPINWDSVC